MAKKGEVGKQLEALRLSPEARAIKAAEPAVDNESQWIPKDRLSPRLQRLLNVPCWPDAELQLMAGFPPHDVARYIQADRGEAGWLARATLVNYLKEVREQAPPYLRISAFGPIHGEQLGKRFGPRQAMLQMLQKQISELEVALDRLWARQQLTGEDATDQITSLINAMVKCIGQAHGIQKDLGLVAAEMPEAQGGIDVEVVQRVRARLGDEAAAALVDPAAQGRIMEAFKRLCQAAGLPGSGLDTSTDYQYREVYGAAPGAEEEVDE